MDKMISKITMLNDIGIALSAEKNSQKVLELILEGAKKLTNADGGSLYKLNDKDELVFEIVSTDSLDIHMGGTTGKVIDFPPLPLYVDGKDNLSMVVTSSVLNDYTINIDDAYHADGFDFSGTRKFDESIGYRTQSLLTIPMKNHKADIIGVLQLINATSYNENKVISFSNEDQKLAESLASQAAVALTNRKLIAEQKALFDAFIRLIATAIDKKSSYTGGHCRRLPVLTMMIAEACHKDIGALNNFKMTDIDREELKVAGWLHDCGKVTTPEYVIDKSTKLETIYDRINAVNTRFDVLKRDAKITMLEKQLVAVNDQEKVDASAEYAETIKQLDEDKQFISDVNVGGEFMSEDKQNRVKKIAQYSIVNEQGELSDFFDDDEIKNLTISRGTLTSEEREVINSHIVTTIEMLNELPFPKHLENVPEYAGGHHERMDGRGYPKGLKRDEMSWPARMMGIADVFEALTARDRPYKDGKKLSECLTILGKMRLDNHIDPAIFDVFVREKVYLQYARKFLVEAQIDEVNHSEVPGYTGG